MADGHRKSVALVPTFVKDGKSPVEILAKNFVTAANEGVLRFFGRFRLGLLALDGLLCGGRLRVEFFPKSQSVGDHEMNRAAVGTGQLVNSLGIRGPRGGDHENLFLEVHGNDFVLEHELLG